MNGDAWLARPEGQCEIRTVFPKPGPPWEDPSPRKRFVDVPELICHRRPHRKAVVVEPDGPHVAISHFGRELAFLLWEPRLGKATADREEDAR